MVWGTPAVTSWADDEEEQGAPAPEVPAAAANPDFPTLGESIKQGPKAKKKGTTMNIGAFLGGGTAPRAFGNTRGPSDKDILNSLPNAPRGDRDEGESADMGGGFKGYGGGDRGGFGRRDGEGERPERRNRDEEFQTSRADETRDWGATRTFTPSEGARGGGGGFGGGGAGGGGPGGERRAGGFGDRPAGASDGIDDWGSSRKFEPSSDRSGGAGGFREGGRAAEPRRDGPPRDGPRREYEPSRAEDGDQWSKTFQPSEAAAGARPAAGGRGFGFSDRAAAGGDEEDRWARRGLPQEAMAPSGGPAPSGERPRLKLQPRTLPVEAAADDNRAGVDQPKKSNPFGSARPRNEVILEKGPDPVKERPVEAVVRDETSEEKAVKDEIEQMRKRLELVIASGPDPESIADEISSAAEDIAAKVKELAVLSVEMDEKVRLALKALDVASQAAATEEANGGGDKFQDARQSEKQHPKEQSTRQPEAREGAPPATQGRGKSTAPVSAGAPGRERW